MFCDLHTHSTYSDGSNSPAEIVSAAKERNLVVALTDHNTVKGLPEFMAQAEKAGVTGVPGVELSTDYEGVELHLLGLFISEESYDCFEEFVGFFRLLKKRSNAELLERLNRAGYRIDPATVERRSPSGNVNRAHVAAELMEQGYVRSVSEAFSTVLHESAGYYVPAQRLSLLHAIEYLRNHKALPILAHPLQELTEAELRALLPVAKEKGLLGMEIFHSSYDAEKTACARRIAEEFDLLPSGGSDFHGANKPQIQLGIGAGGMEIPREIYEKLLLRWKSL